MPKKSARSVSAERSRASTHQEAAKEQAIQWIRNLDAVVDIWREDYGEYGESITVQGIPGEGKKNFAVTHRKSIKKSLVDEAISWIRNLDIIIQIDYEDQGNEVQSLTVKGIPRR